MREAEFERGGEIRDELGSRNFRPRGPDGEDGGALRHLPPFPDNIVNVKFADGGKADGFSFAEPFAAGTGFGARFGGNGDAEGGIADDESGVGGAEHFGGVGSGFGKLRSDLPAGVAKNFDKRLGAAGAAVERDGARAANGNPGEDEQAADAFLGGDGEIGKDDEPRDALVFDGGDNGDVGGAGA